MQGTVAIMCHSHTTCVRPCYRAPVSQSYVCSAVLQSASASGVRVFGRVAERQGLSRTCIRPRCRAPGPQSYVCSAVLRSASVSVVSVFGRVA